MGIKVRLGPRCKARAPFYTQPYAWRTFLTGLSKAIGPFKQHRYRFAPLIPKPPLSHAEKFHPLKHYHHKIDYGALTDIRRIVRENVTSPEQTGAAKKGAGLLTGLLRCRRCGRKLTVRYTGSQHEVLCYTCNRGWLDHGEPRCIAFGGVPVDDLISKQVLAVVHPVAKPRDNMMLPIRRTI